MKLNSKRTFRFSLVQSIYRYIYIYRGTLEQSRIHWHSPRRVSRCDKTGVGKTSTVFIAIRQTARIHWKKEQVLRVSSRRFRYPTNVTLFFIKERKKKGYLSEYTLPSNRTHP